jgi:hypothetical protein
MKGIIFTIEIRNRLNLGNPFIFGAFQRKGRIYEPISFAMFVCLSVRPSICICSNSETPEWILGSFTKMCGHIVILA